MELNEHFRRFAVRTSAMVGSARAFILAIIVVAAWASTGPMFNFSDTWQLIINTGTTIVTFLMVFLIQNTQNRDAKAMHLKLDELIRAVKEARTVLVDLEELSDAELERLREEFRVLREHKVLEEERFKHELDRRSQARRLEDRLRREEQ